MSNQNIPTAYDHMKREQRLQARITAAERKNKELEDEIRASDNDTTVRYVFDDNEPLDWGIGATIIQQDGPSLLLEKAGQRRRVEYVGTVAMQARIKELETKVKDLEVLVADILEDADENTVGSGWLTRAKRCLGEDA